MACIGFDIGADSIRLILPDKGIVFDEPCAVALDVKNNALAIGYQAMELKASQDEEVRVVHPFHEDPLDFKALECLLEQLLDDFRLMKMFRKNIFVVSYPGMLEKGQIRMLQDALFSLGADEVYADSEIWMGALGGRLDLYSPVATCVMNIGYSNCDLALFCRGEMIRKENSSLNGQRISNLIDQWIRTHFNLLVSEATIDQIKRDLGTTMVCKNPERMEIAGVDLSTRFAATAVIDENQVAFLLTSLVEELGAWINGFYQSLPPVYQEDVKSRGIICCGGTMKLKGLCTGLRILCGFPFILTDHPTETVSEGILILMNRILNEKK